MVYCGKDLVGGQKQENFLFSESVHFWNRLVNENRKYNWNTYYAVLVLEREIKEVWVSEENLFLELCRV